MQLNYDYAVLINTAAIRLQISTDDIIALEIIKRETNTKNIEDIYFDMVLAVTVADEDKLLETRTRKHIYKQEESTYTVASNKLPSRPVIVGFGAAGIFAALILAEAGTRPIVLERGQNVDNRRERVQRFWNTGELDIQTNVQFGEGGAGTFSDGKLKTGQKDARKLKILDEFVRAGAPDEIKYLTKPHIGTDRLRVVVKNLREKIISLGGEIVFGAKANNVLYKDSKITGVRYDKDGSEFEIETDNVVLAIGHSARDTFNNLFDSGIKMEQKPFAVGVRIEHPQELINRIKYGRFASHPALGAADYRMVVHLKNSRGVYTFCMCPGGAVAAAASEENAITTNGMSEFMRDGRNANTALLVTVDKKDFANDSPLAGIDYQRKIEAAAFIAGGGGYKAPVQRLEDFLAKRQSASFGDVLPTYKPGIVFAEVDSYLPDYVADSLRRAITEMSDWMPGFYYPDAILTGAETRSTSPVKIIRGENLEAYGINGLYPCGEGAGYAGGIISAAVDGILCAERILNI